MYFNYICLPPPLLLTPSKFSSVPLPNPVFLFQWPTESVLSTHIPAVWPSPGAGLPSVATPPKESDSSFLRSAGCPQLLS